MSARDKSSRTLRLVGLCAFFAVCCAALHTAPGNALASSTDTETSSTKKAGAVPPAPPTQASEQPPRAVEPPGVPDEFMDDEEDYLVRYEDGQLTVDVLNMPLQELLMEVGHQSGAQVRIEGLDGRTVTDTFTRLSLDAALRRLVRGKNFSLVYAEKRDQSGKAVGTRLKELTVYGGTGSVRTYRPSTSGGDSSRPTAAGPGKQASGPGRAPGKKDEQDPPKLPQKNEKVEQAGRAAPAGKAAPEQPLDVEPVEFANPVTAAILGRRPARSEDTPPLEDVSPSPAGFLPLDEEVEEFEDEFQPFPEEFEPEPAVEDEWLPEFETDDTEEVNEDMYEDNGYN